MKKNLYVVIAILFMFAACSKQAFGQISDEEKVRALIQKAEDAWNAHDYSYSGQYDIFMSDAVLVNPVGMYWKNKTEILKGIQQFGSIIFKNETSKYKIKDIRFLAPDVALVIVHSTDRVDQDYKLPDGTKGGSKGDVTEAMYTYTLLERNKNWKISSLHITKINENAAASNPVHDN